LLTSEPALLDDPYPTYAALRRLGSALWDEERNAWIVAGYDDVRAALADPRLSSAATTNNRNDHRLLPIVAGVLSRQLETSDSPEHARMRHFVEEAMVRVLRSDLEGVVREAARPILRRALTKPTIDVVSDFASELATDVIRRVMGIANGRGSELVRATDAFMSTLGGRPEEARSNESTDLLAAELEALGDAIEASARAGGNSLVSALCDLVGPAGGLSREEIVANTMLIFAAGHGTTTSLISSSVWALLEAPRQLRILEEKPELISSAVEEILRLESPIQSVSRTAKLPTWVGDVRVEAGQGVVLLIGSANRDEREFAAPDHLDVKRRPNRHLAFGRGAHLCVGAAVARLQARIAVPIVLRELRAARVAENGVAWQQTPNTRGLSRLILDHASPSILATS